MYRLLALDLDGTIIGPDLIIPEAVIAGVAGLRARGVHVTIATGRMFASTRPFAQRLGLDGPVICYQGALTREVGSGAVVDHVPMPRAAAAAAARALLDEGVCLIAYIGERICVAERRPELERYLSYHPDEVDLQITPDLADLVAASEVTKLLFVAEPERVPQVLGRVAPRFAGELAGLRSHELFGELTALGVSKGAALERLAARLGVAREEVVAVGDQENDLPMVRWAGLGLAVGNAIPSVRAAAAAVLPPVQEAGVAEAIRRYFPAPAVL